MTRKNLIKFWDGLPKYARASVWIATSAALTAILSHLLEQPELVAYYGFINVLLVALKEGRDKKATVKK